MIRCCNVPTANLRNCRILVLMHNSDSYKCTVFALLVTCFEIFATLHARLRDSVSFNVHNRTYILWISSCCKGPAGLNVVLFI